MAERCRQPAPNASIVLDLAADIVADSGRQAVALKRLEDAVRNLEKVKGRYNTEIAFKRLVALLPENAREQAAPATRGGIEAMVRSPLNDQAHPTTP